MRRRILISLARGTELLPLGEWSVYTATKMWLEAAEKLRDIGIQVPYCKVDIVTAFYPYRARKVTGVVREALYHATGLPRGQVHVVNWFDSVEGAIAAIPDVRGPREAHYRVVDTSYSGAYQHHADVHREYWRTHWRPISRLSEVVAAART